MALALAETEAGRAMLLNAAMRQADMGRLLQHNEFISMMFEPWPHYVHYVRGRPVYCAPDAFCPTAPKGPSDCVWIVPGTLEER